MSDLPQPGDSANKRSKHKFLFMITICSQQCNYSIKHQRFYCFFSFAWNADIHVSGKRRNSTIVPKMGRQILVQWTTQYFSLHQDCHHIPAAFCLQHREQKISLMVPENWDHYQIQSRLEVTSMHAGNRCWQIMTSRPRRTVNQPTRWTRKIQRKAFLFGCSPSQLLWRTWRDLLAHSSWKESEVRFGRWRFKSGDTKTEAECSCLLPQKPKEIYSANRKVWWLDNSRARSSAKDMNLGTITDTLSWYKFSPLNGIRTRPKLHRRRRRIYESSFLPSQKPEVFHTYNLIY